MMKISHTPVRRFFAALLAAGCVMTAAAIPAGAGITLWSGVEEENRLRSFLQEGGQLNRRDRYKLYIPSDKLTTATSLFVVSYDPDYDGEFDEDDIELRIRRDDVPMRVVRWDRENFKVELIPEEPIPAQTRRVSIVFSHVRNPRNTGTHHFNAYIQAPTETELGPRYIGTWILQFGRNTSS